MVIFEKISKENAAIFRLFLIKIEHSKPELVSWRGYGSPFLVVQEVLQDFEQGASCPKRQVA